MGRAELVVDAKCTLGEGPCWDHRQQLLYFVDIIGNHVYVYNPQDSTTESINVGQHVGTLAVRETGGLILALQHGFYFLDLQSKHLTPIDDPEQHRPENRFNDGKCDPAGRFWAGTMELSPTGPNGALYCVHTDLSVHKVVDHVTISNGLAWSPDSRTMYYIDTPTQQVQAFDYDQGTGKIENRRVVIQIPRKNGSPDGMTIDEQGMLWVAQWGGSRVTRFNPQNGEVLDVIHVPATNVTSCVFGGENMDELFITTARIGLDQSGLDQEPYAGGLFRYKTGVKGAPSFLFQG